MERNDSRKVMIAIFLGLSIIFSGSFGGPVFAEDPIKIGALLPFTGPLADYGPLCRDGMKMRFEEANYKVAGKPVELIIEDGGNSVSLSLEKAKKLVEMNKVCFVIGHISGDIRMGIAPYLAKNKVGTISVMGSGFEETEFGTSFIWPGTYVSSGFRLGDYMYDELGYRSITSLGADYIAGHRLVGSATDAFREKGGTIINEQWAPVSTADYGPYIANLKEADAVVVWTATGGLLRFLQQYHEFGKKMPVVIQWAASVKGPAMEKLGKSILGTKGLVEYSWRIDNPTNKRFVANFESKFGGKPDKDHANAYTTASVVLAALEATGGDTSFDKIKSAILKLNLDTPHGPLSFTPERIALTNRYICEARVIDGHYTWDPLFTYTNVRDKPEIRERLKKIGK